MTDYPKYAPQGSQYDECASTIDQNECGINECRHIDEGCCGVHCSQCDHMKDCYDVTTCLECDSINVDGEGWFVDESGICLCPTCLEAQLNNDKNHNIEMEKIG